MAIDTEKAVQMFVAHRLRELYRTSSSKKKAPGEWALQKIADDLGISKPQVSDAMKGGGGVGPKFEEGFARRHYSGSVDRLREEAIAWFESQPELPQPYVERTNVAPPNLIEATRRYAWHPSLPLPLRDVVTNQAAEHWRYKGEDFDPEVWTRTLAGLERDAMGLHSKRVEPPAPPPSTEGPSPERQAQIDATKKKGKKRGG